jgi:hypothetical protein
LSKLPRPAKTAKSSTKYEFLVIWTNFWGIHTDTELWDALHNVKLFFKMEDSCLAFRVKLQAICCYTAVPLTFVAC